MLQELCAIYSQNILLCYTGNSTRKICDMKYKHLHFIITAVHVKEMSPHLLHT
jgi:hypothetical protein